MKATQIRMPAALDAVHWCFSTDRQMEVQSISMTWDRRGPSILAWMAAKDLCPQDVRSRFQHPRRGWLADGTPCRAMESRFLKQTRD